MLPKKQSWEMAQTTWAQQLDPVISNLLVNGQLLTDQVLVSGTNAVSHKLGRTPQGWFLVSPQAAGTVYQTAYQINPTLTLTLTSSATIPCSIWVF
jgi:hypothetical protein